MHWLFELTHTSALSYRNRKRRISFTRKWSLNSSSVGRFCSRQLIPLVAPMYYLLAVLMVPWLLLILLDTQCWILSLHSYMYGKRTCNSNDAHARYLVESPHFPPNVEIWDIYISMLSTLWLVDLNLRHNNVAKHVTCPSYTSVHVYMCSFWRHISTYYMYNHVICYNIRVSGYHHCCHSSVDKICEGMQGLAINRTNMLLCTEQQQPLFSGALSATKHAHTYIGTNSRHWKYTVPTLAQITHAHTQTRLVDFTQMLLKTKQMRNKLCSSWNCAEAHLLADAKRRKAAT